MLLDRVWHMILSDSILFDLQRSESSATEPAVSTNESNSTPVPAADAEDIILQTDISTHLLLKAPSKDGPEVRGGHPDALIVLATKATKGNYCFFVHVMQRLK